MSYLRSSLHAALVGLGLCLCGPAVALDDVTFRVSGPAAQEITETLRAASLARQLERDGVDDPRDVLSAAQGDYARMVEALYALGYYGSTVQIRVDGQEAALMDPFARPTAVDQVEIRVDPGPQFRFERLDIAPRAPGTVLPEGLAPGQPARATHITQAARDAVEGWRQQGHAKARVAAQDIRAQHDNGTLDLGIRLDPGPRVTFGDGVVSGDTRVKPPRIRQIAGLPRGEVFDPAALAKAESRLRRTGTFGSVQLTEAETVMPDGRMDILIDVTDRAPRRIGAGAELSSFDGLTLSGFWLHRNILGGAERLRLEGEVTQLGTEGVGDGSSTDYSLSARFEKPAVYGPDTLFFAEAGLSYLDEDNYSEELAALTFGASREFSDQLTGDLGIGLSYARVTDRYAQEFVPPRPRERELLVASLPVALTWDTRDDPLDAARGFFLRGEIEPFRETYRGENGARLGFDGRAYRRLGEDSRTVLAGRLQLGSLAGPDARDAPPDFLFYSGGGGTVRGQPFDSLEADYGEVSLGGRSFAALSGEVRVDLTDRAGLVAFADAGYVDTGSFFYGDGDWHAGAGLGFRYQTPVGPIRFDIAGPLTDNTADGVQFYVGIGQAF